MPSRSFNFPAPQRSRLRPGEIVVDLLAGGGGASEGLKQALGIDPALAYNHDELTIGMHAAPRMDVAERPCSESVRVLIFRSVDLGSFRQCLEIILEARALCSKSIQIELDVRLVIWIGELFKCFVKESRLPQHTSQHSPVGVVQHVQSRHKGLSLSHFEHAHHLSEFLALRFIQISSYFHFTAQAFVEPANPRRRPHELTVEKMHHEGSFALPVKFLGPVAFLGYLERRHAGVPGGHSKSIGKNTKSNGRPDACQRESRSPCVPIWRAFVAKPPALTQSCDEIHIRTPSWVSRNSVTVRTVVSA